METTFKKKLKKLIFGLLFIFLILFIFRLIYGYVVPQGSAFNVLQQSVSRVIKTQKNYATKKYKIESNGINQNVDQKYEKIAEIKTKSSDFEKEEKLVREKVNVSKALIQSEQKSGNKGQRKLNLVIGVPPENFDMLYEELIKIGNVQAKQITKTDKTNEYKELNARKQTLEKIKSSLIELKSKGGKIDEYMALENRILEIEQQLQDLGVSLGDFDDENEFCTVQFSLLEGKEVSISLIHRIKVALVWTVEIYLQIVLALFFVTLFAYLLLLVIEKLKVIEKLVSRNG